MGVPDGAPRYLYLMSSSVKLPVQAVVPIALNWNWMPISFFGSTSAAGDPAEVGVVAKLTLVVEAVTA